MATELASAYLLKANAKNRWQKPPLVTDADLGNSFMIEHQELCLHKAGQNCLKCIGRCPVGAIGEDGIDRHRCFARLKVNINRTKALAGLEETTHVCGKCVVNLPCSIDPLGQQT